MKSLRLTYRSAVHACLPLLVAALCCSPLCARSDVGAVSPRSQVVDTVRSSRRVDSTGVSGSRNLFPGSARPNSEGISSAAPSDSLREHTISKSPDDTTATLLIKETVVSADREIPVIENKTGISGTVNVDLIRTIPSLLGNSDPIRFARLLPSIQVNSESDGGLYMQGSEFSHTMVSIQGVPVYGAMHLLGLFSVFNPPHYKEMHYSTSAGTMNRLGGVIELTLQDTLSHRLSGEVSAGLISAAGTLRIPTGSKSTMVLSARRSYLNLLYGQFLEVAGNAIKYDFTDLNLTWLWKPTSTDRIWVDLFADRDNAVLTTETFVDRGEATWDNLLGSVHWRHFAGDVVIHQTLYGSRFGLDDILDVKFAYGKLPATMLSAGYKASVKWQDWTFGADVAYHRAQPQNPLLEGLSNQKNNSGVPLQRGLESSISAMWRKILGYHFIVEAGVGASHYLSPERENFFHVSPHANIQYNVGYTGKLALRYDFPVQNLFQTGFTGAGLPWEFWFLAGKYSAPQYSHNFALSYNQDFWDGMLGVSAELYYKKLYNQVEYSGSLMEFISSDYSLEKCLLLGEGFAYGANLMLHKRKGPLTGWISYAYGRSMRRFNGVTDGIYPSNHDRPHELKVVMTYDWGKVDVGGSFIAATGIPYTRPESFFIIGDSLITNYGEHNGARLPAYVRLDLSANVYFHRTKRLENGLNISVYNALNHVNIIAYTLHMEDFRSFVYQPYPLSVKILPSISYFHKF